MELVICDIVCNSIWFDPRVLRQIEEYKKQPDVSLRCVGLQCERYDREKVQALGVEAEVPGLPEKYRGHLKSPFAKWKRERLRIRMLSEAIVRTRADLIHANDLDALIPAMQAAEKLHCPVVYDSHELCAENGRALNSRLVHLYLSCYEKKLMRKCSRVVCVSHAAADYFTKKYQIRYPLVVTNCALRSRIPSGEVRKHPGFEVLNHGRYTSGRGYDVMEEALPYLKDAPEIRMAVRGFGPLEEQLRRRAGELADPGRFVFYPPVTVQELIPEAAASHVGVALTEPISLNYRLTVSNKLFEYAAAGLPVLLSDLPEHRYLNERYHFGLILPDNRPETLAQAVLRLYRDPELYEQLAKGAQRLTEEVCWEKEFQKLLEEERQLVRQGKS